MNINDFLLVALLFTGLGVALTLITPGLLRGLVWLFQALFQRPKYLKKTKFKS